MPLNSDSVIKLVDVICEGYIEGLEDGKDSRFLDDTSSAELDSEDFDYTFKRGARTQARLPDFAKNRVKNIINVGQEIGQNYSEDLNSQNEVSSRNYGKGQLIRQITDVEADSFKCVFTIPKLYSTAMEGLAKGQLFNASIRLKIYVQDIGGGGGFGTAKWTKTIKGISITNYQFDSPRIELPGKGPWNIKVKKDDFRGDSPDGKETAFDVMYKDFRDVDKKTPLAQGRGNTLVWTSIVEETNVRTNYPYSVVAALSINTRAYSAIPQRSYLIKGRKVKIPHNAQVRSDGSLSFQGTFDGSLHSHRQWTTCPVCCFYDILTAGRYGAGDFVSKSNLSWVDLYPLCTYANEQLTNSDGSKEPRFALNVLLSGGANAYDVINDLVSTFRGMAYWSSNTIQVTADHETGTTSLHLYTNANVAGGSFTYTGSSLRTRSTQIKVRYNDPDNRYKPGFVIVERPTLISKYGYITKEISAFGCTSKYQARRLGRWVLAAEELDGETVTFQVGLEGVAVAPVDIFSVSDQLKAARRLGGRVVSTADHSTITVDMDVTPLPSGSNPQLTCVLKNGDVEIRDIDTDDTTDSVVHVKTAFTTQPEPNSPWSISTDSVKQIEFRCLSVAEEGEGKYTIVGLEHNGSIYDAVDEGSNLVYQDVTTYDQRPATPADLTIQHSQIVQNNNTSNRITTSWSRGVNGHSIKYEYIYRINSGSWKRPIQTDNTSFDVDGLVSGAKFEVKVRAIGLENKKSRYAKATLVVPVQSSDGTQEDGTTIIVQPPDATDVTIQASGDDQIIFRWNVPPTAGVNLNELVAYIRHSSKTDGTGTWAASSVISKAPALSSSIVLDKVNGEYLVKFRDTAGSESENAVSAIINQPDAIPLLGIETAREDTTTPPFTGDRIGVEYDEDGDGLVLAGDAKIDDVSDIDALTDLDAFRGTQLLEGEYVFASQKDLGGKFTVRLRRTLTSLGFFPADLIDDRTDDIDRWPDIDGSIIDNTSTKVFFRSSNQATVDEEFLTEDGSDTAGDFLLLEDGSKLETESDINYGDWIPLDGGKYMGRQFQFKAVLEAQDTDQTPLVSELGYVMEMPSRTEKSATLTSSTSSTAVTFSKAFYEAPSVGITALNMATGDFYELGSITRTGFNIHFKNSSGSSLARQFSYHSVGYGAEES